VITKRCFPISINGVSRAGERAGISVRRNFQVDLLQLSAVFAMNTNAVIRSMLGAMMRSFR